MKSPLPVCLFMIALGSVGCTTTAPPRPWSGVDVAAVLQRRSAAVMAGSHEAEAAACTITMIKELIREIGQSGRFSSKSFREVLVAFESHRIDVSNRAPQLDRAVAGAIAEKLGIDMAWVVWMPVCMDPKGDRLDVAIYAVPEGRLLGTFETTRPGNLMSERAYSNYSYSFEANASAMAKEAIMSLTGGLQEAHLR